MVWLNGEELGKGAGWLLEGNALPVGKAFGVAAPNTFDAGCPFVAGNAAVAGKAFAAPNALDEGCAFVTPKGLAGLALVETPEFEGKGLRLVLEEFEPKENAWLVVLEVALVPEEKGEATPNEGNAWLVVLEEVLVPEGNAGVLSNEGNAEFAGIFDAVGKAVVPGNADGAGVADEGKAFAADDAGNAGTVPATGNAVTGGNPDAAVFDDPERVESCGKLLNPVPKLGVVAPVAREKDEVLAEFCVEMEPKGVAGA